MNTSKVLAVFVLASFAGCATVQGYKDSLQTWMGHSDSELMQSWGQPNNSYTSPDGKTILEYHREHTQVLPGYTYNQAVTTTHNGTYAGDVNATYMGSSTTYVPHTTPSQVIHKFCDTRFTVSDHTVVAYSFNGNDCVSTSPQKVTGQNNANSQNNPSQESYKKWKAEHDALCSDPEYKIITDRSPCDIAHIGLDLLSDTTKITAEQKPVFNKWRQAWVDINAEFANGQRQYGGVNGRKAADLAESTLQPANDKNALDLYEGKITWGEYLQKRIDIFHEFQAELKRITQP